MSGKLAEIEARIGSVEQLSAVIAAMRGIAAAHSAEASHHLDGVRAYAGTVGHAIGQALALLPAGHSLDGHDHGPHAIIAFCAEQGFAGSFSARILARAEALGKSGGGPAQLMIVGDRGLLAAAEAGIEPAWSTPMILSVEQASMVANRIMDAIYERIADGRARSVSLVHARPGNSAVLDIVARPLVPFDLGRFPVIHAGEPPQLNLPPARLLTSLVEEYVFAELCEAVILSFAAENEARMRAMVAAQQNVSDTLEDLVASARRSRQDEITSEIGELSGSILGAAR